jgi:hypothetical protein
MKSLLPCSFISIAHLPSANYTSFGIFNKVSKWPILTYFLDLEYGITIIGATNYGIERLYLNVGLPFLVQNTAFVTPEVSLSQPPADLRP